MTYIKVSWKHDFPYELILMFSELNVINEDAQFEGVEIEKDEFEKEWKKALEEG